MGEAKRRQKLDPSFGKPSVQVITAQWSLVVIVGIDNLATINVWQGERATCESTWLKATHSTPETLKRLERNGFVVSIKPDMLVQLALVKPEAVQDYVNMTWAALQKRRLKPMLTIADGEAALAAALDLWDEAMS